MNKQNTDGIGCGWAALLGAALLVTLGVYSCASKPAHGSTEVEPGEVVVCAKWEGEWTASVHSADEAAGILAAIPGSFILDTTTVPPPSIDGAGCASQADEPTPTAPPATATATKPSPTATATARPTSTATALPPATPTATAPPTATPVPPVPVCPGASVQARVSITGVAQIVNSTGTSVGPFALTVTTTSRVGVVVRTWQSVTAPARASTIVGDAFDGVAASAMGRWFSVAQLGGTQCAAVPAGDGFRVWFPVMVKR